MSQLPQLKLEKQIFTTLIYYDSFSMGLTAFEIFTRLSQIKCSLCFYRGNCVCVNNNSVLFKIGLNQILKSLDRLIRQGRLVSVRGYYFLKKGDADYQARIDRRKIGDQKWKKTIKMSKWLRTIPFLRGIFASGSLALGHMHKDSDLDVLVIAEAGRIWTTRVFVTILSALLGARRKNYETIAPDKICSNHYITTHSLNIPHESIYTAHLYLDLRGIYFDNETIFTEFYKANSWIKNYFANEKRLDLGSPGIISINKILMLFKKGVELTLGGTLGNWLEKFLAYVQKTRIDKNPNTYKKGGRVIADNFELEFHPSSPEVRVINEYNKKALLYGLDPEVDSGLM